MDLRNGLLKDLLDGKLTTFVNDPRFNPDHVKGYLLLLNTNPVHHNCVMKELSYMLADSQSGIGGDKAIANKILENLANYQPFIDFTNQYKNAIFDIILTNTVTFGIRNLLGDLMMFGNIITSIAENIPINNFQIITLLAKSLDSCDQFAARLSKHFVIRCSVYKNTYIIFLQNVPRLLIVYVTNDIKKFLNSLPLQLQTLYYNGKVKNTNAYNDNFKSSILHITPNLTTLDNLYKQTNGFQTIWYSDNSIISELNKLCLSSLGDLK